MSQEWPTSYKVSATHPAAFCGCVFIIQATLEKQLLQAARVDGRWHRFTMQMGWCSFQGITGERYIHPRCYATCAYAKISKCAACKSSTCSATRGGGGGGSPCPKREVWLVHRSSTRTTATCSRYIAQSIVPACVVCTIHGMA